MRIRSYIVRCMGWLFGGVGAIYPAVGQMVETGPIMVRLERLMAVPMNPTGLPLGTCAGDVGKNGREEVDLIETGGNHGWAYGERNRLNLAGGSVLKFMIDPLGEPTTSLLHGMGENEGGELYPLFRNGDVLRFEYGPTASVDASLDNRADAEDLSILANNWRQEVTHWTDVDFNGDGFIDAADLNLLAISWQSVVEESLIAVFLPSTNG